MITTTQVHKRMMRELFSQPLMDNAFRGVWCEYMVAEALGPECKIVGTGWHPWDLQIGEDTDAFPKRIRIQVKNSAALQPFNAASGRLSQCEFHLKLRKRPFYFTRNNPAGVHCENFGFLCELFVLCWHDEGNLECADHRDVTQWKFFILPVVGPNSAVTDRELALASSKSECKKPTTLTRRPSTLARGIRGRPPVPAIGIGDLSIDGIRQALD